MTVDQLLIELDDRDITLSRDGDDLHYNAPEGAFMPALKRLVREHKPALLQKLAPKRDPDDLFEEAMDTLDPMYRDESDADRKAGLMRLYDALEDAYLGEDITEMEHVYMQIVGLQM